MAKIGIKGGSKMVWPSLDVASRVADIANMFFIGSLTVGVIASVAIIWMANVKEAHWDRFREASNEEVTKAKERIAELTTHGKQLENDTAIAKQQAAEATERSSRIEQAGKWRELSPAQKLALLNIFKLGTGSIDLSYPANDSEALFFALQIGDVLKEANLPEEKWAINFRPRQFSKTLFFGLNISGEESRPLVFLRAAFSDAGIAFSEHQISDVDDFPGMIIARAAVSTKPTIYVGSKPVSN
jgi:hypothetical protein